MKRLLLLPVMVSLAGTTAAAPAPARVQVNSRGNLEFPAATVRALHPAIDRHTVMVCIEFPWPAGAHPGEGARPPKVWVTVRRDGSIVVPRTRIGDRLYVPADPGTQYVASPKSGHISVRPVAARRR